MPSENLAAQLVRQNCRQAQQHKSEEIIKKSWLPTGLMACISWPDGWQGALQHPLQGNGQMVRRASESLLNLPLSKLGKSATRQRGHVWTSLGRMTARPTTSR